MIQPLRRMHRAVFAALAIALPVLFICGLLARHAPLSAAAPNVGSLAQSNRGTEFVLSGGSTRYKLRLIENKSGAAEREFQMIPGEGFPAPDVLVYWSETPHGVPNGSNAKFLGRLATDGRYPIPSGSGYLLFYSLAEREVLGSIPVGAPQ